MVASQTGVVCSELIGGGLNTGGGEWIKCHQLLQKLSKQNLALSFLGAWGSIMTDLIGNKQLSEMTFSQTLKTQNTREENEQFSQVAEAFVTSKIPRCDKLVFLTQEQEKRSKNKTGILFHT